MATIERVLSDRITFTEMSGLSARRASEVEHWTRWIVASFAKHFDDRRRGIRMFVEGQDHPDDPPDTEWMEVRVDGPFILEPSKGFFNITVEVNVMIATQKNDQDIYRHYRNCGTVNQAFLGPVKVFKYGTGIDDDQSLLGCFVLLRSFDQREALRVCHFGQLDATVPLMRSSVEGHYLMQLHG